MKKSLLTLATLGLVTVAAQAQWANQPIAFPSSTMGIVQVDVVNATTAWGLALDPFTGDNDLARTTNGTTWTAGAGTSLGATQFITFFDAVDANTAWVTTVSQSGGKILKTTDGGVSWTAQTTAGQFGSADSYPDFVHFFNATEGVAVGDPDGTAPGLEIYTTTNGGTTWTRALNIPAALGTELGALNPAGVTTPPAFFGNSIWFPTTEGRVYYSTNKGQTWSVSNTGLNDEITAISFASATNGLAMVANSSGGAHQLKRTTDGGATWTSVTYTGTLRAVALDNIPGKTGYVSVGTSLFGDAGSSYSFDNGATWTTLETTTEHTSLDLVSATEGWTGGINPTTFSGAGVNKLNSAVLSTRRDMALQQALSVYPNPSHDGVFTLNLASLPQATELRVTDALGREVYRTALSAANVRASSTPLDLRQQKAGLYTLELRSDKGVAQQKLVIQ